jgi:uncharacterized RDD family membrane protein YckC
LTNAPPPPVWSDRPLVAAEVAPPGGFWIRFVAYMIDGLVMLVPTAILVGIFAAFVILTDESMDHDGLPALLVVALVLLVAAMIVVNWLYEALMTSSPRGATLGKMALGLRILRFDGTQLSFGRATARHFAKFMVTPMVPLAIGYIMAAFTNRKRALHDILADTLVIKSP